MQTEQQNAEKMNQSRNECVNHGMNMRKKEKDEKVERPESRDEWVNESMNEETAEKNYMK